MWLDRSCGHTLRGDLERRREWTDQGRHGRSYGLHRWLCFRGFRNAGLCSNTDSLHRMGRLGSAPCDALGGNFRTGPSHLLLDGLLGRPSDGRPFLGPPALGGRLDNFGRFLALLLPACLLRRLVLCFIHSQTSTAPPTLGGQPFTIRI